LERIAGLLRAEMTAIFSIEPMAQTVTFSHVWGEKPVKTTEDGVWHSAINPFLTIAWHCAVGEPHCLRSFMSPEEFRQTPFYKEFMAQQGWLDFVAVALHKSSQCCMSIGAARHESAGAPSDAEMELMRLLAPHLRRALRLQEALDAKDRRLADLSGALDLAPNPIILLDAQGALCQANLAAETFVAHKKTARIEQGRLRFDDAEVEAKLLTALAAAACGGGASARSAAMRSAQGDAFAMEMLPLTSAVRQISARDAVLAVFIQKVGAAEPLPGEVLVKLYGFTPAETRLLVLLAQERTLGEAADVLGVSQATVKTQLQRVFAKTGTSRQADVIKLVMSALPRQSVSEPRANQRS